MNRSIRVRRQTLQSQSAGLLAVSCIAWLDLFEQSVADTQQFVSASIATPLGLCARRKPYAHLVTISSYLLQIRVLQRVCSEIVPVVFTACAFDELCDRLGDVLSRWIWYGVDPPLDIRTNKHGGGDDNQPAHLQV